MGKRADELNELTAALTKVSESSDLVKVRTPEDRELALDVRESARRARDLLQAASNTGIEELHTAHRSAVAKQRELLAPFERFMAEQAKEILEYDKEGFLKLWENYEDERDLKLERFKGAQDKGAKALKAAGKIDDALELLSAEPEDLPVPPKGANGTPFKWTWYGEDGGLDPSSIPPEYTTLAVDVQAVDALVKELGPAAEKVIPGLVVELKGTVRHKRKEPLKDS